MLDLRAPSDGHLAKAKLYDTAVDLNDQGQTATRATWLIYEQSGSTYAFNARVAYRLTDRRRSSPYVGGWLGLRVEDVVLSDPKAIRFETVFGYSNVVDNGTIAGNAAMERSTTHISFPIGLRLGFDLRAGPVYLDTYLYGGYKIGSGKPFFNDDVVLTGRSGYGSYAFEALPLHFGAGIAMGMARLKKDGGQAPSN